MRIIYLHQYFNTLEMSGGTRSYEMARRLVAKGHEVHMVTSWRDQKDDKDWFETKEAGINIHWLPVPYSNHMSYGQRIKAFLGFAFSAARKAASLKGDVIFATSTPLTISLPAVYAAKRLEIPMVFEVRDLWPELPIAIGALKNPLTLIFARWLEKWSYRNSEAVIALSPGMRDGVVRAGYPVERIAVIPNSSDVDDFKCNEITAKDFRHQREWLGDRPLLVYTGTFGRINGVSYLVEIATQLKKIAPEVRILLVGGGLECEDVRAKAQISGVLDVNLFMQSAVPKKDMPALLAAADMASSLFVDLPEMQANSANKFFDALAAGKPVMLNYGGWQDDLVEATGIGLVTWQLSFEEAAREIASAIQDKDWLKKASKASKNLGQKLFDRDTLACQLEEVLLSAQKRNGGKAQEISSGDFLKQAKEIFKTDKNENIKN